MDFTLIGGFWKYHAKKLTWTYGPFYICRVNMCIFISTFCCATRVLQCSRSGLGTSSELVSKCWERFMESIWLYEFLSIYFFLVGAKIFGQALEPYRCCKKPHSCDLPTRFAIGFCIAVILCIFSLPALITSRVRHLVTKVVFLYTFLQDQKILFGSWAA